MLLIDDAQLPLVWGNLVHEELVKFLIDWMDEWMVGWKQQGC